MVVLATTTMGLRQTGYDVVNADTGDLALRLCRECQPDLALLDIRMPVLNGIEVAKELKAMQIPFIFLSAYGDEDMVKSAAEVGALGYLIKPVEVSGMVSAIEVALMRAVEQVKSGQSIENLTHALENNREIDVAIGLLMERYQINRISAFDQMRRYARAQRLKLVEVAKALISGDIQNILPEN